MATYYWVGGSGTWDAATTTNWSLTSGGSGGAGVPTSVDDVVFDVSSGTASDTVTVATGAEVNSFLYTADGEIDFSGAGQELRVYGSFQIIASIPLRIFNVDTIFFRVTGSGSVINTAMPLKNLTLSNWTSPLAQTTFTFAEDVTCDAFISSLVSLSMDFYKLTCDSCRFTGSSTSFARSVSNGSIDIYPPSGTVTAFDCVWAGSLATFTMVSVSVIDAVDPVIVTNAFTPSGSTSFSLTVSNSTVSRADMNGGLNSLTLESGATVAADDFNFYGELDVGAGCTLSKYSSSLYGVQIKKKTSTPNVSRLIQVRSGGTWEGIGLTSFIAASTDFITIAGDIGTALDPVSYFYPGIAYVSSVNVHASDVGLESGVEFDGTIINAYNSVASLGTLSVDGVYTINARNCSFVTDGAELQNVNIFGTSGSSQDFTCNDLTLVPEPTGYPTTFNADPGSTVTVLGDFVLDGLAAPDNILLRGRSGVGATGEFFLVKSSGTVNASFATITDCNASGGATFNAYESDGCVDGGGNTGWNFSPPSGFFIFL
jgi:hypothetical protein